MADVPAAFAAVPRKGTHHDISGDPILNVDLQSHVQGIVRFRHWLLLSYSHLVSNHGFMLVVDARSEELIGKHETPSNKLDHPGGMQMCGDFLFVATEKVTASQKGAAILMYDLSTFDGRNFPKPDLIVERSELRCGAVGVTVVEHARFGNHPVHLVVSHDNEKLTFFHSNGRPLDDESLHFEQAFYYKVPGADTSNVALFTDSDHRVYMIGLRGKREGGSYRDSIALYDVDLAAGTVTQRGDDIHLVTTHGGIRGAHGVHLRWGATIRAVSESAFEVLATQMHFAGRQLSFNTFTASSAPPVRRWQPGDPPAPPRPPVGGPRRRGDD